VREGDIMRLMKGRRRRVSVALLVALTLVSSACGSRLSKQERKDAITALTSGGRGGGTTTTGDDSTAVGGSTANDGGTTSGGSTGGGSRTVTSGGGSSGGGSSGDGTSSSSVGSCAKATKGGKDPGLTADKIKIATLADISGVQPGLFQSAHDAAKAAAAYINSTGGICGRQIVPDLLDSKTDSGGNRAAMQQACAGDFVVVGSVSAFDDGSAQPGQACGIPDMTAVSTNRAKYNATNTFPAFPNGGGAVGTTSAKYLAKAYPDAIKHAAILWLDQAVAVSNAALRKKVWESVGFKWVYERAVQVLQPSYTSYVSDMKNLGVQYITFVGDYQNIVRLQKSMKQQGFFPKVRDWDSVAYSEKYLQQDPEAVEGSFVFINTAMVEEAGQNEEMKLYTTWLQRAAPGAIPDYFGIWAWSAYRLFQKVATQIGPDITRTKVLSTLKATSTWNGFGIHGPTQVGAKKATVCTLYLQVKSDKFKRMWPASGFDCSGKLVNAG
jgi:ABC-type branched-subunit amino acid transport system substrate-binding protein